MLDPDTRLRPNREQIAAKVLDGEAIIINLATGAYYAMADVGGLIWEAIERHSSPNEIAAEVGAAYDVTPEQARADVFDIASQLILHGVVDVAPETAAHASAPDRPPGRLPYATPRLTAFNDMRNLLALDPPTPVLDAIHRSSGKPQE